MTGRAMGVCNVNATPGMGGRGRGRGAGRGMGRCRQQGFGPQGAWARIEARLEALEQK